MNEILEQLQRATEKYTNEIKRILRECFTPQNWPDIHSWLIKAMESRTELIKTLFHQMEVINLRVQELELKLGRNNQRSLTVDATSLPLGHNRL